MKYRTRTNQRIGIVLLALALLLSINFVSALEPYSYPLCIDSDEVCKKPYLSDGDFFDIYCDLDEIVSCSGGCNNILISGLMFGECSQMGDCIEGHEKCGLGIVEDPNGDAYECLNGGWTLKETCGDDDCVEQTYNNAYCDAQQFFCLGHFNCFYSSNLGENCYETRSDCENAIPFCCTKDDVSIYRTGSCRDGENSRQWNGMTKQDCEANGDDPIPPINPTPNRNYSILIFSILGAIVLIYGLSIKGKKNYEIFIVVGIILLAVGTLIGLGVINLPDIPGIVDKKLVTCEVTIDNIIGLKPGIEKVTCTTIDSCPLFLTYPFSIVSEEVLVELTVDKTTSNKGFVSNVPGKDLILISKLCVDQKAINGLIKLKDVEGELIDFKTTSF